MFYGMFIFSPNSSICSLGPWGGKGDHEGSALLRGRHGRHGRSALALMEKDPARLFTAASMGGGCKCEGWPSLDTRPVGSLLWKFLIPEFWEINSLLISYLVYVWLWLLFAGLGLSPGSHVQFMLILLLLLGQCSLWYFCYCWLGWTGTVKQQHSKATF